MVRCFAAILISWRLLATTLWAQPTFDWPVPITGVQRLNGTFGEPRPNPFNPSEHRHHWHKGIDIAEDNGEPILAPASGTYANVGTMSALLHHGSGNTNVGWHTQFQHVSFMVPWPMEGASVARGDTIGFVTRSHCHVEVYEFDEAQSDYLGANIVTEARNPLNYPNFADYPDAGSPRIEEIRFNLSNDWNGPSAVMIGPQFESYEDLPDTEPSQVIYFLAHAYDDLTNTGATGPYSVKFSILENRDPYRLFGDWNSIVSVEYQFDNLLEESAEPLDQRQALELKRVYAEGTEYTGRSFYFSKSFDLLSILTEEDGLEVLRPVNTYAVPVIYRFQVDVEDARGGEDSLYRDILVPIAGISNPEVLVERFSAEWEGGWVNLSGHIRQWADVEGFRVVRRRRDEDAFTPIYHRLMDGSPSGREGAGPKLVGFTYRDRDVLPGEVNYYTLEIQWKLGKPWALEVEPVKVEIPGSSK